MCGKIDLFTEIILTCHQDIISEPENSSKLSKNIRGKTAELVGNLRHSFFPCPNHASSGLPLGTNCTHD